MAGYLEHGDAVAAWRAVFSGQKFTAGTVERKAYDLLIDPAVQAEIINLKRQIIAVAEQSHPVMTVPATRADVEQIIEELATADASELVQLQVRNCRYCHGVDHRFQWHTPIEYARKCARIMDENAEAEQTWIEQRKMGAKVRKPKPTPIPSDDGGYGFQFDRMPHSGCPECLGEGKEHVRFADTRTLSGKAKRLFAGVKQTANGIEIITRNQDVALKMLAQMKGVQFAPDGSGPTVNVQNNGGQVAVVVSSDPVEASRTYRDLMTGGE